MDDDVYIFDGQGIRNNGFAGDVRVVTVFPNGAGVSTQFSVTGAGSNYLAVIGNPPTGDVSYVSSNTPGQIDLYTLPALAVIGTILGVQTVIDTRKDDAGIRQLAAEIRFGGTNYQGSTFNMGVGYLMQTEIRETNPNTGIAWVTADIANTQLGFVLVA